MKLKRYNQIFESISNEIVFMCSVSLYTILERLSVKNKKDINILSKELYSILSILISEKDLLEIIKDIPMHSESLDYIFFKAKTNSELRSYEKKLNEFFYNLDKYKDYNPVDTDEKTIIDNCLSIIDMCESYKIDTYNIDKDMQMEKTSIPNCIGYCYVLTLQPNDENIKQIKIGKKTISNINRDIIDDIYMVEDRLKELNFETYFNIGQSVVKITFIKYIKQ